MIKEVNTSASKAIGEINIQSHCYKSQYTHNNLLILIIILNDQSYRNSGFTLGRYPIIQN